MAQSQGKQGPLSLTGEVDTSSSSGTSSTSSLLEPYGTLEEFQSSIRNLLQSPLTKQDLDAEILGLKNHWSQMLTLKQKLEESASALEGLSHTQTAREELRHYKMKIIHLGKMMVAYQGGIDQLRRERSRMELATSSCSDRDISESNTLTSPSALDPPTLTNMGTSDYLSNTRDDLLSPSYSQGRDDENTITNNQYNTGVSDTYTTDIRTNTLIQYYTDKNPAKQFQHHVDEGVKFLDQQIEELGNLNMDTLSKNAREVIQRKRGLLEEMAKCLENRKSLSQELSDVLAWPLATEENAQDVCSLIELVTDLVQEGEQCDHETAKLCEELSALESTSNLLETSSGQDGESEVPMIMCPYEKFESLQRSHSALAKACRDCLDLLERTKRCLGSKSLEDLPADARKLSAVANTKPGVLSASADGAELTRSAADVEAVRQRHASLAEAYRYSAAALEQVSDAGGPALVHELLHKLKDMKESYLQNLSDESLNALHKKHTALAQAYQRSVGALDQVKGTFNGPTYQPTAAGPSESRELLEAAYQQRGDILNRLRVSAGSATMEDLVKDVQTLVNIAKTADEGAAVAQENEQEFEAICASHRSLIEHHENSTSILDSIRKIVAVPSVAQLVQDIEALVQSAEDAESRSLVGPSASGRIDQLCKSHTRLMNMHDQHVGILNNIKGVTGAQNTGELLARTESWVDAAHAAKANAALASNTKELLEKLSRDHSALTVEHEVNMEILDQIKEATGSETVEELVDVVRDLANAADIGRDQAAIAINAKSDLRVLSEKHKALVQQHDYNVQTLNHILNTVGSPSIEALLNDVQKLANAASRANEAAALAHRTQEDLAALTEWHDKLKKKQNYDSQTLRKIQEMTGSSDVETLLSDVRKLVKTSSQANHTAALLSDAKASYDELDTRHASLAGAYNYDAQLLGHVREVVSSVIPNECLPAAEELLGNASIDGAQPESSSERRASMTDQLLQDGEVSQHIKDAICEYLIAKLPKSAAQHIRSSKTKLAPERVEKVRHIEARAAVQRVSWAINCLQRRGVHIDEIEHSLKALEDILCWDLKHPGEGWPGEERSSTSPLEEKGTAHQDDDDTEDPLKVLTWQVNRQSQELAEYVEIVDNMKLAAVSLEDSYRSSVESNRGLANRIQDLEDLVRQYESQMGSLGAPVEGSGANSTSIDQSSALEAEKAALMQKLVALSCKHESDSASYQDIVDILQRELQKMATSINSSEKRADDSTASNVSLSDGGLARRQYETAMQAKDTTIASLGSQLEAMEDRYDSLQAHVSQLHSLYGPLPSDGTESLLNEYPSTSVQSADAEYRKSCDQPAFSLVHRAELQRLESEIKAREVTISILERKLRGSLTQFDSPEWMQDVVKEAPAVSEQDQASEVLTDPVLSSQGASSAVPNAGATPAAIFLQKEEDAPAAELHELREMVNTLKASESQWKQTVHMLEASLMQARLDLNAGHDAANRDSPTSEASQSVPNYAAKSAKGPNRTVDAVAQTEAASGAEASSPGNVISITSRSLGATKLDRDAVRTEKAAPTAGQGTDRDFIKDPKSTPHANKPSFDCVRPVESLPGSLKIDLANVFPDSSASPSPVDGSSSPTDQFQTLTQDLSIGTNSLVDSIHLKDTELKALASENAHLKNEVTTFLNSNTSTSKKVSYLIKRREEEIERLNGLIVQLQLQSKSGPLNAKRSGSLGQMHHSATTRRSSISQRSSPSLDKRAIKATVESAVESEVNRLKDRVSQVSTTNTKLQSSLKEKEAKITLLKRELCQQRRSSNPRKCSVSEDVNKYLQSLHRQEEEMSKMRVKFDEATHGQHNQQPGSFGLEQGFADLRQGLTTLLTTIASENPGDGSVHGGKVDSSLEDDSRVQTFWHSLNQLEHQATQVWNLVQELSSLRDVTIPELQASIDSMRLAKTAALDKAAACEVRAEVAERGRQADVHSFEEAASKLEKKMAAMQCECDSKCDQVKRLEGRLTKEQEALQAVSKEASLFGQEVDQLKAALGKAETALLAEKNHAERTRKCEEEAHAVALASKQAEVDSLLSRFEKMSRQAAGSSSDGSEEVHKLKVALSNVERHRTSLKEHEVSALRLKDEEMEKLYAEIGELSANLHASVSSSQADIANYKQNIQALQASKNHLVEEYTALLKAKQGEITALMTACQEAQQEKDNCKTAHEKEISELHKDQRTKVDVLMNNHKNDVYTMQGTIESLRKELDTLLNGAQTTADGKIKTCLSVKEMREKLPEQERALTEQRARVAELQAVSAQLETSAARLREEKVDLEGMIERMSKECDTSIDTLCREHATELERKDDEVRAMYLRVEAIARERGDVTSKLHQELVSREAAIQQLEQEVRGVRLEADHAQRGLKTRFKKRLGELDDLSTSLKSLGKVGVHLLETREKELGLMKVQMKGLVKAVETQPLTSTGSCKIKTSKKSLNGEATAGGATAKSSAPSATTSATTASSAATSTGASATGASATGASATGARSKATSAAERKRTDRNKQRSSRTVHIKT